ncbi:MAG: bifunctional glutamate N-acetyltransferase/amino-acid acetyltransferase ArgJ [Phototrophicaceae bacterium]
MQAVKPNIDAVMGFQVAGTNVGLKRDGIPDFALFVSATDCTAAAVFTTNHVKAAPVVVDMEHMQTHRERIRAVVANSKNANACTGEEGIAVTRQTAQAVAHALDCEPQQVLVLSTGVIGVLLDIERMKLGVQQGMPILGDDWASASQGIMTTDLVSKLASVSVTLPNGGTFQVAGVAKGSGMIAPNMATMLSVVVTDAALPADALQMVLNTVNQKTFNSIVVDGDMSTNDTVLLLANGASGCQLQTADDLAQFEQALYAVCRKLAQDIVRDGEGATKFITLNVKGCETDETARQIAHAIATSALVKTAFFGADANWGRIIAAAGRAGVPFSPDHSRLTIEGGELEHPTPAAVTIFAQGKPTAYSEADATAVMQQPNITIWLEGGLGTGQAQVWTCDFSYDYVRINGDYRT